MSLDTSSGAYEQLYDNSAPEETDKYYEGYIEMKGKFKWSKYWCVLKKTNLHFFKDVNTQIKDNYEGYFPLEGVTNIEPKAKNEWNMIKKSGKITLKTANSELRDTWLQSFVRSMKGEPPISQSYILPGSGPASPVKRQPSLQSDQHSPAHARSTHRKTSGDSVRYRLPEEQIRNLNELAQQTANNVAMNDAEIKIQEMLLADQSWYQSTFRREDVERILSDCENGVFIVRDFIDSSTSRKMGYVISLKDQDGGIRHHKIVEKESCLFIKGYETKRFNNLHNLLRFFIMSQKNSLILKAFKPFETHPQANRNTPSRSASVSEHKTAFQHRGKPRSVSVYSHRSRPVPPVPTQDPDNASYLNMNNPIQQRPLPSPPPTNPDGVYIAPLKENKDENDNPGDSYVHMQSPIKSSFKLERIPSGIEFTESDPNNYVNLPSSPPCRPSYENVEPSPILSEQPPRLPPRRLSQSVDQPYVNLPADRPPRPPLRKARTLDR